MSLQWNRIVAGAFVMELALIAIAIPLFMSGHGAANLYVIPPAALVLTCLVTIWLGRRFASQFVLHGALIGLVGSLMYVALTRGQSEPWPYLLAHLLKIAGGACGGYVLERQTRRETGPAHLLRG